MVILSAFTIAHFLRLAILCFKPTASQVLATPSIPRVGSEKIDLAPLSSDDLHASSDSDVTRTKAPDDQRPDPCAGHNGGCSHDCVSDHLEHQDGESGFHCECPDYMILSRTDEETCFFPTVGAIPGQLRHVPPKVLLVETFDRNNHKWAAYGGRITNATCGFSSNQVFMGLDFSGSTDRWRIVESPSVDLTKYPKYLDLVRFKVQTPSHCENSGSNHVLKLEYQKNGEPWAFGKQMSLLLPLSAHTEAQIYMFETIEVIPQTMRSTNTRFRLVQESNGQAWALDEMLVYKIMYDSCRTHICQNGGTCEFDTSRTYFCNCPPNYHGGYCEIASPCLVNNGLCSHTCAYEYRGPKEESKVKCSCPKGLLLGPNERTCEVYKPRCQENNGGCSHLCVDLIESQDHYCSCPDLDRVVSDVDDRTCVAPDVTPIAGSLPNATPTSVFADTFHKIARQGWEIDGGHVKSTTCDVIPYIGYHGVDFSESRFQRRSMVSPEIDLTRNEEHLDVLILKVVTSGACANSGSETEVRVEFRAAPSEEWVLAKTLSLDLGQENVIHIVRFTVLVPPPTRSVRTQFRLTQGIDGKSWALDEAILYKIIFDSCQAHKCQNQGTCRWETSISYSCECPPGFSGRFCEFSDPCEFRNGGCSHECRRSDHVTSGTGGVGLARRCFCPNSMTLGSDLKSCIAPSERFEQLLGDFGYSFQFAHLCLYANWEHPPLDPEWEFEGGQLTDRGCSQARSRGRPNIRFSGPDKRTAITPEINLETVTGASNEVLSISFGLSVWGGLDCDPLDPEDQIVAELRFKAIPNMPWQRTYQINFSTFRNTDYTIFSFSLPTSRLLRLLRINPRMQIRLRQLGHDGDNLDVWTLKEFVVGVYRRSVTSRGS